jgi:hypothetical protein
MQELYRRSFLMFTLVVMLVSHRVPFRVADRGMLALPDMEGTGEIKYPGQTKTSTTALRLREGSVKARGRKL